jgi:hypothetical protein
MNDVGPWYTASGVPQGSDVRYAFVGENGAPKTTALTY